METNQNPTNHIAIFKGKSIRKTMYQKEWWFSILDIIHAITDSPHPKTYWAKMKERDKALFEPFPFWEQLKLPAEDENCVKRTVPIPKDCFALFRISPHPRLNRLNAG
ncbi:MAG: hypothetical protein Q7S48_04980 [bacterium]|nr:hypothetical protein [bacterium]